MRIEGQPAPPSPITPPTTAPAASQEAPKASGDALDVSRKAQRVADAQRRLAALPEVRMDKLVAVQSQLDAGAYHPDGAAVAEGLIQDHLMPPRGA